MNDFYKERMAQNNLYHYTDVNACLGIVSDCEMWFSRADKMKDYTENRVFIETLFEETKKYLGNDEILMQLKNQSLKEVERKPPFIFCFTKDKDSYMHWFNERLKGKAAVCIVFDAELLYSLFGGDHIIGEVDYCDGVYRHQHILNLVHYVHCGCIDGYNGPSALVSNIATCGYMCKHKSFEGEHEIRIATFNSDIIKKYGCIEAKKYPEDEKVYKARYQLLGRAKGICTDGLIKKIIIGPLTSGSDIDSLKEIAERKNIELGYSECPVK